MFESLNKAFLFKGFSSDEIKTLFENINYSYKSYKTEEFIAFRGDKVDAYMILVEGELVAEMQKINGKVVKIETLLPYADIAPAFVFGMDNSFPVDLYATQNSKLLYIPKAELLKLLQKNTKILENLLNSFSNRTQFLSKKIWFINKTIEEKLATHILENLDKNGLWKIKNSITDLASVFGVSRPSLSRVITQLVEDSVLDRLSTTSFKLINKEALLDKF